MIPHIQSGQHLDWGSILIGVGFRDAHGVRYNSGYTQVYITLESTIEVVLFEYFYHINKFILFVKLAVLLLLPLP